MVQKTLPPGQLSAGLPQPLAAYYAPPIIAKRDPTVNDTGYPLGQVWDDKVLNRAWILTSVVAGSKLGFDGRGRWSWCSNSQWRKSCSWQYGPH